MKNDTWIEPPPPHQGTGCCAKGCLILIVFFIVLGIAFVGGSYLAIRYLRREYFPTSHVQFSMSPATEQEQEAVRARWDAFEKAARAHEAARIEMTANDLNALIDSEPRLHGRAHVSIKNNVAHLQVSIPVANVRWLRGHYINAECAVQSAADGSPSDARVTQISVNGRAVGDEVVRWQYGSWSLRRYMSDWSNDNNLERFEVADGKVILQTKSAR